MSVEYRKIEQNTEVMDVLFAIIKGEKTPQSISKKLKVSGIVVRSKLQFLRKNKLVIKNKWDYSPNWDGIYLAMLKASKEAIVYYEKLSKKSLTSIKNNLRIYFPKELLSGIIEVYSTIYFNGYEKVSMKEMLLSFLAQLSKTDHKKILKRYPKLSEVLYHIQKIPTREEMLFDKL